MIETWILFILFCYVQVDVSQADDHEYRLVRDLMRNYDPRIRPSRNSSEALNVTFGLALAQVIDVDEKNQIITTNSWINQAWIDNKLRWDPQKYGGIKVVRLPYDTIWRPDILLYNNADISSYKSSISSNVIVSSDGNVTWLSMTIFRSSCPIDVRYFPFDEQNCSMQFASWTYDGFQVNLEKVGEDGDVSNYIQNSEWDLVKLHVRRNVITYSCCAEPYPDVTYKIQLRRRPLFYVFNLLFPCLLLTLVALLGFYIPSQSGEKVTMGITTLLSMTVFLMLVAESMPPTSEVLPLIGLYFGINIVIVSLATAMTVITLNIHNQGHMGQRVPPCIRRFCFGFLAKVLCVTIQPPDYHWIQDECEPIKTKSFLRGDRVNIVRRSNDSLSRCPQLYDAFDGERELRRLLDISKQRRKANGATCTTKPLCETRLQSTVPINKLMEDNASSALDADSCAAAHSPQHPQNCAIYRTRFRSPPPPPLSSHAHPSSSHLMPQTRLSRDVTDVSPGESVAAAAVQAAKDATCTSSSPNNSDAAGDRFQKQFLRLVQKVCDAVERNEMRLERLDEKEVLKLEWNLVAVIVDRLLLWIFVIVTLAVTFGVTFNSPHAHEFIFKTRTSSSSPTVNVNPIAGNFPAN